MPQAYRRCSQKNLPDFSAASSPLNKFVR
jgi:hypothetical protein